MRRNKRRLRLKVEIEFYCHFTALYGHRFASAETKQEIDIQIEATNTAPAVVKSQTAMSV